MGRAINDVGILSVLEIPAPIPLELSPHPLIPSFAVYLTALCICIIMYVNMRMLLSHMTLRPQPNLREMRELIGATVSAGSVCSSFLYCTPLKISSEDLRTEMQPSDGHLRSYNNLSTSEREELQ